MKKITALLLLACMMLSLFACGGSTTTETGTNGELDCWTYDEAGNKQYLPIVDPEENVTLKVGIQQKASVIDYNTNVYTTWLEEQTGVHVEFVKFSGSSSDITTQVALMIAGGEELPDVFWGFSPISQTTGREYGNQGYFIDLKPYFDDPEMSHFTREAYKEIFGEEKGAKMFDENCRRGTYNKDGGIYAFVNMEEVPFDSPICHTVINQQWLDKLGLEAPKTIDELYDVLVAFRDQDPNGNGKKDEIPMIAPVNGNYQRIVDYILNAFVYTNSTIHFNVTDGKVWTPYNTEEYRQGLIFIRKLVKDGLLSPLSWTMKSADLISLLNPTDGVYTVGISAGHGDVSFTTDDAFFTYSPLAPLADATGKGGYGARNYYPTKFNNYISADCKIPEIAFRWLDFQMSGEAFLRQRWGEYGVDWEYSTNPDAGSYAVEIPAKIVIHDPNIWAEQNNKCWHTVDSIASEYYYSYEVDLSDATNPNTKRVSNIYNNYLNYKNAGLPDEMFWYASYTDEEIDLRAEFTTDLSSYISLSRTNFCTGDDDPADDATWNKYLTELEGLRYSEYVETAQKGYERVKDLYSPY